MMMIKVVLYVLYEDDDKSSVVWYSVVLYDIV